MLGRTASDLRDQVGDVPGMAQMDVPFGAYQSPQQIGHGPGGLATKTGRFNLRAVSDVLQSYGLDPIAEVAQIVMKTEPVLAKDGTPVLDKDGKPVVKHTLPQDVRVKALLELAQYERPKLKSVEVKQQEPDLPDAVIDRRIEALLARRAEEAKKEA